MKLVEVENVTKIYGSEKLGNEVRALDGISLTIKKGETISVIGSSGSGKSTLLNMIGAVDKPTSGKILVDGEDVSQMNDDQLSVFRRRKIGFIFQSFHLIPVLSVEDNIKIPVLLDKKKPDNEYIEHIIEMLGLADRRNHLPSQLSGGQQQRVAIARALANHPSLVLADEPTGSLDSKNGEEVMALLKNSVAELGQTLVVITHNIDIASQMDRIIKISDGKIVS